MLLSRNTVKSQAASILRKLGASSRSQRSPGRATSASSTGEESALRLHPVGRMPPPAAWPTAVDKEAAPGGMAHTSVQPPACSIPERPEWRELRPATAHHTRAPPAQNNRGAPHATWQFSLAHNPDPVRREDAGRQSGTAQIRMICICRSTRQAHRSPAQIRRYARFMPVIGGLRTEQAFTRSNSRSVPMACQTSNSWPLPQAGLFEPDTYSDLGGAGSLCGSLTTRSLERS
jgi:hypothetical protein